MDNSKPSYHSTSQNTLCKRRPKEPIREFDSLLYYNYLRLKNGARCLVRFEIPALTIEEARKRIEVAKEIARRRY